MNYSDLVTFIQDEIRTTETSFVSNIPNFVKQAEERIYLQVDFPALKKNQSGTFTSSNRFLSLPTDVIYIHEMFVLSGTTYHQVLPADHSAIRAYYPSTATTGRPRYYGFFDKDTVEVAPTPDTGYTVELHYQYRPETIVTASTTWLGDVCGNALKYASFVEAYIYLKGSTDVLEMYEKRYVEERDSLVRLGLGYLRKDSAFGDLQRVKA